MYSDIQSNNHWIYIMKNKNRSIKFYPLWKFQNKKYVWNTYVVIFIAKPQTSIDKSRRKIMAYKKTQIKCDFFIQEF